MNIQEYLAIPYSENGRTEQGSDCYGLVRVILQNELKIELPAFSYVRDQASLDDAIEGFREVDSPQDYDIVYMKGFNYLLHVGVWFKGGIIHMTASGASYQKASVLKKRILAYYRPRK
ncbi:NlpC/P60 family protein [uncultured Sphaerochaeta sp.]|uniref:NlpC/P60 family protein n=1 Tax=uncultured Sphaerochaeta sp. TaxID=886478 RepID=UPI0029CA4C31|nr:NlpC/P60 family protein [uncultured Sphaerochaeta sp.]